MTAQEEDDVYAGHLNFKDGKWVSAGLASASEGLEVEASRHQ